MTERPSDDASQPEPELEAEDWAEEIKRLRAERGAQVAARLAEDPEKEPPVA
ncbi:MAG: hypothetical protein ABJB55_05595 [Actinomycetota bacterium]